MSDVSKKKKQLRQGMIQKLESLTFFELIEKSERLREAFFSMVTTSQHHFNRKYIISFYPFETEPQLNIEDERQNEPYRIAYVRIDDWNARRMSASAARRDQPEQWEDIEPLPAIRIFQPNRGQPVCKPEEVAAILVPGLAFSRECERLGRGAGFYDRFLTDFPEALRIGLAYFEQIRDSIPTESFDQNLDIVLTDKGVFETNRYGEFQKHGKIKIR